jgi:hypothetical protein
MFEDNNNVHETRVRSSSGNSTVNLTMNDAIQCFSYEDDYYTVKQLVLHLRARHQIRSNLNMMTYIYDLNTYLMEMKKYDDDHKCITWTRIRCLNEMTDRIQRARFIQRNFVKLIWDTLHAIVGFYICGYSHHDCTIDNIGYFNGYFVLFDYNLNQSRRNLTLDTHTFVKSVEFNLSFDRDFTLTTTQTALLHACLQTEPLDEFVYTLQMARGSSGKPETFIASMNYLRSLTIEQEDRLN